MRGTSGSLVRLALVTATAVALVATEAASPAAAATTTTDAQVVVPPTFLDAVACSSPTTCYATGQTQGSTGGAAIVPITNGVAGQPQVFPPGYRFSEVVCPSATTCVVYGGYKVPGPRSNPTNPVMVVITNGVIGAPQPVPGNFGYSSVACSSAAYCVGLTTVRVNGVLHQAVVAITNGVPGPAQVVPAGVESLSDVACASATTCHAVGQSPPDPARPDEFGQPQPTGVVLPITNGVEGAAQVVPGTNNLFNVACSSATTCFAVGFNDLFQPVVVPIVNGTPGVARVVSGVDVLTAIACLSATTCEAVGFRTDATGVNSEAVVVPIVNGIPGAVHPVTGSNGLQAVACSAPICVAIGSVNPPNAGTRGVVVIITEPGPTDTDACKDGGWRSFNNPPFKNQGDCVSAVTSHR